MDDLFDFYRIKSVSEVIAETEQTCAIRLGSFLLLGCEDGSLITIDLITKDRIITKLHSSRVVYFDYEKTTNTLISAGLDGDISIIVYDNDQNLFEAKEKSLLKFDEQISSVCLVNNTTRTREIIIGSITGSLIMHTTNWFSPKNVILFEGDESAVTSIKSQNSLLIWSDFSCIRVLDISNFKTICSLQCPYGVSIHQPMPTTMLFNSDSSFWVGWADKVQLVKLSSRDGESTHFDSASIAFEWKIDGVVSGMALFDSENILLSVLDEESETSQSVDLQLRNILSGSIVSCDQISFREPVLSPWSCKLLPGSNLADYNLWNLSTLQNKRGLNRGYCPIFTIISNSDIVFVKLRDINDRVRIALNSANLKVAAELACQNRSDLKFIQSADIISAYIDKLLSAPESIELAAQESCRLICSDEAGLWERTVLSFIRINKLEVICPLIPERNPKLSSSLYSAILDTFLRSDTRLFLSTILNWISIKHHFLDSDLFLDIVEDVKPNDNYSLEAKAIFFKYRSQFDLALKSYLKIRVPRTVPMPGAYDEKGLYFGVFDLIVSKNLFSNIKGNASNLVLLSKSLSANFFVQNYDRINIHDICDEFRLKNKTILLWFLNLLCCELFDIYNSRDYGDLHTEHFDLFIEISLRSNSSIDFFKGDDFMKFLRLSDYLDLEDAISKFRKLKSNLFHSEIACILCRLGRAKEAIAILLYEVKDIPLAICYIKDCYDEGLKQVIVDCCKADTSLASQLFEYIPTIPLNPNTILSMIPLKTNIVDLKSKLRNILNELQFDAYILDHSNSSQAQDLLMLSRSRNQGQRRAVKIDQTTYCGVCYSPIHFIPKGFTTNKIVYEKRCVYHQICYETISS